MRAALLAAPLLLLAAPAVAQDVTNPPATAPVNPPETGGDRITVALGAASVPDYEGASSNEWIPAGAIIGRVSGIDFFTRGTQLYVDLVPDAPGPGTGLEFGPIVAARFDRTNKVDQPQVRALGKIDTAWEVGGFVGVTRTGVVTSDYDVLTLRLAYLRDVSDTHDSYVLTPQINYTTPLSTTTLVSLGASADYVGKGYGRTYFSVTPAQSLASGLRPFDAGKSGWKRLNLQAFAVQSLSGDLRRGWGIGAGVLYGRLFGRYKDSPIVRDVGDADQWSAAVGITYTF